MSESVTRVRASSWGSLFDCAHRWEGTHLLGLQMPSSPRALLGTAIHASTAAFDAARMAGAPITPDDAAGVLVDTLHTPPYDVDWTDDLTPPKAEATGLKLHTLYCQDWSPRFEFAAVELETKPFRIDCGRGQVVELVGTMDRSRIRRGAGGIGIADLKTGATAVAKGLAKTKGHAAQVGTYELLFEHTTGETITAPAEIVGMKTKGTPEIAVAEIRNARDVMVGTDQFPGLIEIGAEMLRTGLFPPNPQSMMCHQRYCARWSTCPYHE
ncbi:RecB family exonuclease [Chitinimonas lacunae]|uniref:RecB family exonuclease n=1 Tax=Chitinimonas lacunae TaxID=1963018 RepID=A0ABV8MY80_9NEIS